jgi:coproporphyrinogen III oxidase-like Fe-S oxidoreductase
MTDAETEQISEYYSDKMAEFNQSLIDTSKSFENEKGLDMFQEFIIRLEDEIYVTYGISNYHLRTIL